MRRASQRCKGAKKIYVTQARRIGDEHWQEITEPVGGVRLAAADIMINAREIDRFEEAHGIGRARNVGPGVNAVGEMLKPQLKLVGS